MLDLKIIRKDIENYCEGLRLKELPYGSYLNFKNSRCDLYSSADVAIMRKIMGEDLEKNLTLSQRNEWIGHINSFVDEYKKDGSYTDTHGHSPLHANGMVIGALGALGGKQRYENKLYDDFSDINKIEGWLSNIDWSNQWPVSHLFWGGMHCFSMSAKCTSQWIEAVFSWLDKSIDENTGFWRKGASYTDRHQQLGGFVHIVPMYQHHNKEFKYAKKVIDSVLNLQLERGNWLSWGGTHVMHYLELDALYALKYMSELEPNYRKNDIEKSIKKYMVLVDEYYNNSKDELFSQHPHMILGIAGCFGLLYQLGFLDDDIEWTDIFSNINLYKTKEVEV